MSFRMSCPKCGTANYNIERERSSYSRVDPVASLVFACTCGKRLYGKQVEEEYLRQKKYFEQDADSRAEEAEAREVTVAADELKSQAMSDAMAYRARFEANQRAREEEDAVRTQKLQVEKWQELVVEDGDEFGGEGMAVGVGNLCAWLHCDKGTTSVRAIRRKGSKYCSRDCSNKNARWRHKQRKGTNKVGKA